MPTVTHSNNFSIINGENMNPTNISNAIDANLTTHSGLGRVYFESTNSHWIACDLDNTHTSSEIKVKSQQNGGAGDILYLKFQYKEDGASAFQTAHTEQVTTNDSEVDTTYTISGVGNFQHVRVEMSTSNTSRYRKLQVYEFGTTSGSVSGTSAEVEELAPLITDVLYLQTRVPK